MNDAVLIASVTRKADESARLQQAFFRDAAPAIASCARAIAARFDAGARLFTLGNGGSACDAQHAAVEFVHPIHERRPGLPAIALPNDVALLTAIGNDEDFTLGYAHQLKTLGAATDVALGISTSGESANVVRAIQAARAMGMLTVAFAGKDGGKLARIAEHAFVVPSFSIHRIQEAHATLLHVLWDLVHVVRGEEDVVG